MGYNPNIKLNPQQLALIEDALRAERSRAAGKPGQTTLADGVHDAVHEITDLLAHLHHQKRWFKPKQAVPLG